ncbi:UNVERIFIED_CONTAM: DUF4440 domain-containing protein [Halobacillus marinus]
MEKIEKVLDAYFSAWNEGFATKEAAGIRAFMSKDFVGYWSRSDILQPDPYFYDYDLEAVLKQMDEAEKTFEIASIGERKDGQEKIVLGRETNVIQGTAFSAQCMFVWRKEADDWKLVKEYIELER